MTELLRPDSDPQQPGYEKADVGPAAIGVFALALGIFIAISMPLIWWLLQYLETGAKQADPDVPPLAVKDAVPPAPRLQSTPIADYAEFKTEQLKRLGGIGWVDREQKIVHIPIGRAMELVLEEGLPMTQSGQAPSESTSDERPASQQREPSVPAERDNPAKAPASEERDAQPPAEDADKSGTENE
jgi:hypothetical protein